MNRNYTVSIVIPIYKNWYLCQNLLSDLLKHEKDNIDKVVVIDDCSEDAEVDGGLEFWKESGLLPITVITPKYNGGFTISANIGLRHCDKPLATRHITFLISSDVRIGAKFIDQTANILFGAKRAFVGGKILPNNTGWNEFDGRIFDYLEGWLLACTSDGWRDIGYFDENYAPFDYEDIDISTTAKRKGYRLVALSNPHIRHLGGKTIGYNPAREAITKRNREYFRKKWVE